MPGLNVRHFLFEVIHKDKVVFEPASRSGRKRAIQFPNGFIGVYEISIFAACSQLLGEKGGGAVSLYLYYLASGVLEPGEAMSALVMDREEYAAAYARLVSLDLLPAPRRLPDETPPSYTREEIAGTMESDPEFRELLAFTEQKLGRIASQHEIETLLSLYHWMGLPCGVIMLIVSYCAGRAAEEGGRRLTVSQIQKTANKWSDQGIDTTEKADSYLRTLSPMCAGFSRFPP